MLLIGLFFLPSCAGNALFCVNADMVFEYFQSLSCLDGYHRYFVWLLMSK